jgi:hypothetical protein
VTYSELFLGIGDYLHDREYIADGPLFILDADEVNTLAEAYRLQQCGGPNLIADFIESSSLPNGASFSLGQLLYREPYRLKAPPAHLLQHFDDLRARLRIAMPTG